jgi:hypothetical protein
VNAGRRVGGEERLRDGTPGEERVLGAGHTGARNRLCKGSKALGSRAFRGHSLVRKPEGRESTRGLERGPALCRGEDSEGENPRNAGV